MEKFYAEYIFIKNFRENKFKKIFGNKWTRNFRKNKKKEKNL